MYQCDLCYNHFDSELKHIRYVSIGGVVDGFCCESCFNDLVAIEGEATLFMNAYLFPSFIELMQKK